MECEGLEIHLANPICPRDCPAPSSTPFHRGPDGGQLVGVPLLSPNPSQPCDGCEAWLLGLVVACSQERCHLQPALPDLRRDLCPCPGASASPSTACEFSTGATFLCLLSPAACSPAACPLPAWPLLPVPLLPVGWGHSQGALPSDAAMPTGPCCIHHSLQVELNIFYICKL